MRRGCRDRACLIFCEQIAVASHRARDEIVEVVDTRVQVVEFIAIIASVSEMDRQYVSTVDFLDAGRGIVLAFV